jgi:DNA invertase Pin-like site-specific DNA recombinase
MAPSGLARGAAAERHGWQVVAEFSDAGISGSNGRDQRPGCNRLMKGIARREFDMVAAWSVDRLSRSLSHLVAFLGDIHAKGVDRQTRPATETSLCRLA